MNCAGATVRGMDEGSELAAIASLLAHGTRAQMLCALMDGRARPAGVLARAAGCSASNASGQLAKLVEAGLLTVERRGRQRCYALADARVAETIETLSRLAAPGSPRSLREANRSDALAFARSCYDHLAGRVGVALAAASRERGLVEIGDDGCLVTASGKRSLTRLGVDVDALARGRRPLVRLCLDWTEREPHLSGALGAALLSHFLASGWLVRVGPTRALQLTSAGHAALRREFGLGDEQLQPS